MLQGKPVTADSGPQASDKGRLRRAVANKKESLFQISTGRADNVKSQVNSCMKIAYNCSKLHEHNADEFLRNFKIGKDLSSCVPTEEQSVTPNGAAPS